MSNNNDETRTHLASRLAALMMEERRAKLPHSNMLIHWDDCDMDERCFWFHFRLPRLETNMLPRPPEVQRASKFIRQMKILTKEVGERESDYALHWSFQSRPLKRYVQIDRQKYPDGYDCDTWIYVLTFYG